MHVAYQTGSRPLSPICSQFGRFVFRTLSEDRISARGVKFVLDLNCDKMALAKAQNLVSQNAVVVFSKSYCPYCKKVKELLSSLGAKFTAVELDQENDGNEIQSALADWTKQRTVPNVFIGGQQIGDSDATMSKHNAGQLVPLLKEADAV